MAHTYDTTRARAAGNIAASLLTLVGDLDNLDEATISLIVNRSLTITDLIIQDGERQQRAHIEQVERDGRLRQVNGR